MDRTAGWKPMIAGLLLVALALFADAAMAADLFAMPSGDKSASQMIDPIASSGKIATLFGTFNAAILFLGGILSAYGVLAGVAQTAHDGEMLGRRWSSLWVPIRVSLGIAAIVPVGNGFCMAQQVVMYVAQSGVGAAAGMWGAYVDMDQNDVSSTSRPTDIAGVRELALGLLKSKFCSLDHAKQASDDVDHVLGFEPTTRLFDYGDGQFSIGTGENPSQCGSYVIPDYSNDETGVGAAHVAAFMKLSERMEALATRIHQDPGANRPADNAKEINAAIYEYNGIIGEATNGYVIAKAIQTKFEAKQASIGGWIMAGAYASSQGRAHATASEVAGNVPKASPTATSPALSAAVATPNKENSSFVDSLLDKAAAAWNNTKEFASTTAAAAMNMVVDPLGVVSHLKENFKPFDSAMKGIMNGTGNPISNVQILGGAAIEVAGLLVIAAIVLGVFTTTGGMALLGIAGVLFSFGAVNYFYLPIAPALYYYAAVIGWFVLYVECLIAAPIWALMHVRFDGEGMVGSAASGYKIILNMFLRPSLITIAYGIALGSMEFLVSGWNKVFAAAVAANFDLSATSVKPYLILSAEFCIYTVTMIAVIHQVLKMIPGIPESITKWIDGGHDGLGSSASETMGRMSHAGSAAAAGAVVGAVSTMGRHGGWHGKNKGGPESPSPERNAGGSGGTGGTNDAGSPSSPSSVQSFDVSSRDGSASSDTAGSGRSQTVAFDPANPTASVSSPDWQPVMREGPPPAQGTMDARSVGSIDGRKFDHGAEPSKTERNDSPEPPPAPVSKE